MSQTAKRKGKKVKKPEDQKIHMTKTPGKVDLTQDKQSQKARSQITMSQYNPVSMSIEKNNYTSEKDNLHKESKPKERVYDPDEQKLRDLLSKMEVIEDLDVDLAVQEATRAWIKKSERESDQISGDVNTKQLSNNKTTLTLRKLKGMIFKKPKHKSEKHEKTQDPEKNHEDPSR